MSISAWLSTLSDIFVLAVSVGFAWYASKKSSKRNKIDLHLNDLKENVRRLQDIGDEDKDSLDLYSDLITAACEKLSELTGVKLPSKAFTRLKDSTPQNKKECIEQLQKFMADIIDHM